MNRDAFIIVCMNRNDTNDKLSETFLSNLKMPTLSEGQKQSCEGEISLEELESVLNSFQNNKSPGYV